MVAPDSRRGLPVSLEAEKGVLCSFLLDPPRVGSLCAEQRVTPETFHVPAHGRLYAAIERLWSDGQPVDIVTLTQALADAGTLEMCGGAAAVTELFMYLPTAANAAYYLAILRQKKTLREIIRVGTEYAALAYEDPEDPESLLAGLERAAMAISAGRPETEVEFSAHVMAALDRVQERAERKNGMIGLPTGLAALDKLTGGLASPDYIVVSAETSGGKTALACRFISAASVDARVPVAVYSYEMTNEEVTDRLLVSEGRVNMLNYRQGWLTEGDMQALTRGASRVKDARIFLRDDPELNIGQVRASARRIKQRHGLGLVVIDYAQLVPESSGKKGANREQEVAFISRQCKAMAKELDVPVVVLSQLNDEGKLRESRAISHDANMILLIQEEDERHYIRIAKQRNGPRDRVPVTFLKQFTRFEDYHGGEEPPAPKKAPAKHWQK